MNQQPTNVSVGTLEGRITPRRLVGRVWAALLAAGSEGAEREAALILAEHVQQVIDGESAKVKSPTRSIVAPPPEGPLIGVPLMPPPDPDLLAELCEHQRRELEKPATINARLRFWFWGSLHWPCRECEREQHAAWVEDVTEQFRNAVGAISRGESYEWNSGFNRDPHLPERLTELRWP